MIRKFAKRLGIPLVAFLLLATLAGTVFAQDGDPMADMQTSINIMWMLIAGFLVFFMQAGFALVETGFTRAKNVAHTMMMNIMVFCIGAIGFFLTGFALEFGGVNFTFPATAHAGEWAFGPTSLGAWGDVLNTWLIRFGQHGILGGSGFALMGIGTTSGVLAFFLFQMVFMDTAATIPTGSMAERLKFVGFCLMGLWVSMFIYPVIGAWVWGGGWLANLGRSSGLGNGVVDFAGSGVVHMVGGSLALVGAIVIGPRIGRFNKNGSANAMPGHNIPMGILGTIILFFGWFGFNPGSSLSFVGGGRDLAIIAAINTLLAGAAGGISAMLYVWVLGPTKKPDPGLSVNGVLAGLVAITAPCAFVGTGSAIIIGLVAGVIVCLATFALERWHIDDPVGAAPVHLFNGAWGLIALGLFANGNPITAGWNGVDSAVTGLLYDGGFSQLFAQLIDVVAIFITVGGLSWVFFKILNALNLLRSEPADELMGLDIPEMGVPGYTQVDVLMAGGRLSQQMPAVRASAPAPTTVK